MAAINKSFVIKNGLEVSTNLIFADAPEGKVGIGTTNPEYLLHVKGGIGATNSFVSGISTTGVLHVGTAGTVITATAAGSVGIGTTNPTSKLHVVGDVRVSGVVTATDFNSTSDISLKDNIQTIINPLDKIIKLNGVTFNWKENQKPSIGVIAQELQEILPELVTQGDIKSVNYNGLIGVLIEAVKEQQKQIEELLK